MKKTVIAGLALIAAGALVFGAGFVGAHGDLSVINGNFGPFGVHFTDGNVHSGFYTNVSGSSHGIGGGRDKPVTTPPPTRADEVVSVADVSDTLENLTAEPEGLREIIIKELYADVEILPSDDGEIHISAEKRSDFYCEVSNGGGVLSIERKGTVKPIILGFDSASRSTLRVCVPEGMSLKLEIENNCGDITVSDLSFGGVELETALGNVSIENVKCSSAELDSSMGSVLAQNVQSTGDLSAESDMGDVLVDTVSAGGKLTAESSYGAVTVSNSSARELELGSDMGNVSVFDSSAQSKAELDCSFGSIEFRSLSAGREIDIDNDMGSIEGTLAGSMSDYSIESSVDLGSSNLPASLKLGSILLTVTADCGSIDISFEDD